MWLCVKDVMTRNFSAVTPETTVREATGILSAQKLDCLPVVEPGGKIVGLFTKSTIFKMLLDNEDMDRSVGSQLKTKVTALRESASLKDAWDINLTRIPVVSEEGILTGVLSRDDLVKAFYDQSQELHSYLKSVLDSTYNGIVAINSDGLITLFNQAAGQFTGWGREEAVGKHVNTVIPNSDLVKILETGEPSYSQSIDVNGRKLVTNRNPIYKDGHITGAVGVFQDISALESISQEMQALKNLNRELDTIIETCHDAIVLVSADGTLERVNTSYERMSGLKSRAVVGKKMQELVETEVVNESISLTVLREGKPMNIIQKLNTGREIFFTGIPIYNEQGNINKVISTGRDMTELNFLKSELERAKTMTSLYHIELQQLRKQHGETGNIVFSSEKMRKVFELAVKVSQVDTTVLLLGESGVGKEVLAKVVHSSSKRDKNDMVKINCAAIPEHLLESEFFGYSEGAFTGAKKGGKAGLFETANNSTIFLDEISELPLNLQAKLLRVLQEKEIVRIGGTSPIKVNVRILAATNRDLAALVKENKFREDLYYRLNVVPITIPPLRERKEDIIPLIFYFLRKFNDKYSLKKTLSSSLLDRLIDYEWPGNVRELENIIERMMVVSFEDEISDKEMPLSISQNILEQEAVSVNRILPLKTAVDEVEKTLINKALEQCKSIRGAAKVLGINASTILRKKKSWEKQNTVAF